MCKEILPKHNLYVVGGAVRNTLMDLPVKDLDLAIECSEAELETLAKTLKGYKKTFYANFGVLRLERDGVVVEVTMTRTEQYRGRNRKPIVEPASIEDDLARRDFTCNAIAYDLRAQEIMDPYNGVYHAKRRFLQLIPGNEEAVFKDDPLRILRAFRFTQQYDMKMSTKLTRKITQHAKNIEWLSKERIYEEFVKMAGLPDFHKSCDKMMEFGVLNVIFPRIIELRDSHFCKNTKAKHKNMWTHTLQVIANMEQETNDPIMRIVALLHDCGKPDTAKQQGNTWTFYRHEQVGAEMARAWLNRLKFSKRQVDRVFNVIAMHQLPAQLEDAKDKGLRRFINRAGKYLDDLLMLASVDFTTRNPAKQKACRDKIDNLRDKIKDIQDSEDFVNFQLAIDGHEIVKITGLPAGPEVGKVIAFLTALVMDDIIDNKKDVLVSITTRLKETYYGSKCQEGGARESDHS